MSTSRRPLATSWAGTPAPPLRARGRSLACCRRAWRQPHERPERPQRADPRPPRPPAGSCPCTGSTGWGRRPLPRRWTWAPVPRDATRARRPGTIISRRARACARARARARTLPRVLAASCASRARRQSRALGAGDSQARGVIADHKQHRVRRGRVWTLLERAPPQAHEGCGRCPALCRCRVAAPPSAAAAAFSARRAPDPVVLQPLRVPLPTPPAPASLPAPARARSV